MTAASASRAPAARTAPEVSTLNAISAATGNAYIPTTRPAVLNVARRVGVDLGSRSAAAGRTAQCPTGRARSRVRRAPQQPRAAARVEHDRQRDEHGGERQQYAELRADAADRASDGIAWSS